MDTLPRGSLWKNLTVVPEEVTVCLHSLLGIGVVGRGPRIQAETTYTRRLLKRWVSLRGLRMNDDTFAKQSARVLPSERLVIAVFKLKIWLQRMRLEDRGIFR